MAIIRSERFKNYRLFYIANGRYVRPPDYTGDSLFSRLKQAWLVFTGQCDVLQWDDRPVPKGGLLHETTDVVPPTTDNLSHPNYSESKNHARSPNRFGHPRLPSPRRR